MKGIMSAEQREALHNATVECARFTLAADRALARDKKNAADVYYQTREMGAVKRASLDLSASLVAVRKGRR